MIKSRRKLYAFDRIPFDAEINSLNKWLSGFSRNLDKVDEMEEVRISKILSKFSTINNYKKVTLLDIYKIKKAALDSSLMVLTFNTGITLNKKMPIQEDLAESEFVGLTSINCDVGQVFIRPESLNDKIIELINPVEIDFKNEKKFSSRYYVLAENEKKIRNSIDSNILSAIGKQKGLYIEICDMYMLIRTMKPITEKSIEPVVELINDLNQSR